MSAVEADALLAHFNTCVPGYDLSLTGQASLRPALAAFAVDHLCIDTYKFQVLNVNIFILIALLYLHVINVLVTCFYLFQVKKCGKPDCAWHCKFRSPPEVSQQLRFLPNPRLADGCHSVPFERAYMEKRPTSQRCRAGCRAQKNKRTRCQRVFWAKQNFALVSVDK